jgi:hypothetical protein
VSRDAAAKKGSTVPNLVTLIASVLALGCLLVHDPARADDILLPLPPGDQKNIAAKLGPNVVGKALPSEPINDVSVYFPLQEKALTYRVTAGANMGKMQVLKVTRSSRPNGAPAWRFQLSPTLFAFLRQGSNGDLLIPAVSDIDHGVVVITTPANPFVLKGMKPGDTRSFAQTVSVNYLNDPTSQDYAGSLTGTYAYIGTYEVTVPAGTFPALLVRVRCEGKVGPAHTEDTAYYFFSPGMGVVAMIMQEDAEAFWIIHIDSTAGKVLASNN